MNNLNEFNVFELSSSEQKAVNGGFWLITAAVAYSIFSVWEYPDAFERGVKSTFESSL